MSKKPTNLYKPGESGNKRGRPPGAKNASTLLAEAVRANAMDVVLANFPKLVEVAVKKAQEGDAKFAKMLLDRVWPVTDGDPSKQKGSVQVKITVNGIPNEKIIDGDAIVVEPVEIHDGEEDDEEQEDD